MKVKVCIVILFAGFSFSKSMGQPGISKETGTLTVEINNFRNNKGNAGIALYMGSEGFPKSAEKAINITYSAIINNKSVALFKNLPVGEYAISICHDENNNKKLDTNFFGIPKEGIGTSNNAKGRMGPPKYRDAKFDFVRKSQTITIKIAYL